MLPTLARATGDAELEAVSWHILVARAGTPAPIAGRLRQEISRSWRCRTLRKKSRRSDSFRTKRRQLTRYIKAETDKWGALVRSLGLEGSE
jgi:tripartite-type tricarboxylate transporter receptor subunit TctC